MVNEHYELFLGAAVLLNARTTAWLADDRYGRWVAHNHAVAYSPKQGRTYPTKRPATNSSNEACR